MAGFLPARGSLMLDAVALAMIAISILMLVSILLVRRRKYQAHKRLQSGISVLLLLAVGAFELDMRFFTDWRELAAASAFYGSGVVDVALAIHLLFAIPTPFVWAFVVVQAFRHFPRPVQPSSHSRQHKRSAWIAVGMMLMTAITGWVFYILAFVL